MTSGEHLDIPAAFGGVAAESHWVELAKRGLAKLNRPTPQRDAALAAAFAEAKRLRDTEQGRLTDNAYEEAKRLLAKHRSALDRVASALLEKETLSREELAEVFDGVDLESRASEAVGVVRALGADPTG